MKGETGNGKKASFMQRGQEDGARIAITSDIGHWFRNDMGFCKRCSFVRRKYHDSI